MTMIKKAAFEKTVETIISSFRERAGTTMFRLADVAVEHVMVDKLRAKSERDRHFEQATNSCDDRKRITGVQYFRDDEKTLLAICMKCGETIDSYNASPLSMAVGAFLRCHDQIANRTVLEELSYNVGKLRTIAALTLVGSWSTSEAVQNIAIERLVSRDGFEIPSNPARDRDFMTFVYTTFVQRIFAGRKMKRLNAVQNAGICLVDIALFCVRFSNPIQEHTRKNIMIDTSLSRTKFWENLDKVK